MTVSNFDTDDSGSAPSPQRSSRSAGDILEHAPVAPGERRTITEDIDVAVAEIRDTLAPVRLHSPSDRTTFTLDLRRFRGVGVELSLTSVGGDIDLTAPPLRDHYIIVIPVAGSFRAGTRNHECMATRAVGIVMSPDQAVHLSHPTDDSRQLCVRIDKSEVTSALSLMLGRPIRDSPRFEFRLDVTSDRARPLMQALEMAALEVLEDADSPARSVLASTISKLVVETLVLSQENSYTEELRHPSVDPDYPHPIRTAQQYILMHAGEPICITDIARAANLSVRALQEGFARYLHIPPMVYLRDIRLVRAHDDLRRFTADQSSVRTIAERWGFRHAGRFSTLYREHFGISPSEELRDRDTTRHSG